MGLLNRASQWIGSWFGSRPQTPDMFELLNFAWIGQAVYVATALEIPTALAESPKSAAELARAACVGEGHLRQVLRALVGFGVLTLDNSDRYANTTISQDLVQGSKSWMREYILLWGEQLYPAAGELLGMLRTGRQGYELAFDMPLYEHYKADPAASRRFVDFMNSVTDWQRAMVLPTYDFAAHKHIVDVGGGRASMLTSILQNHPHLRGTILDQPHMAALVNERLRETGLADRCEFVGGNFLESVPAGADLYFIKHVLHDWADADVSTILKNISAAMPAGATLIIVEGALDPQLESARLLHMRDLEQMFWTGGKVRSRDEFAKLLAENKLELIEIRHNGVVDTSILIARKV